LRVDRGSFDLAKQERVAAQAGRIPPGPIHRCERGAGLAQARYRVVVHSADLGVRVDVEQAGEETQSHSRQAGHGHARISTRRISIQQRAPRQC